MSGPLRRGVDSLDLAVRNIHVLARDTVGLVRRGEPAPALLGEAVLDLVRAVADLDGYLDVPGRVPEALESRGIASPSRQPKRRPPPSTSAMIC